MTARARGAMLERMRIEHALFRAAAPNARLRWEGAPLATPALMAELGCLGPPVLAGVLLGLSVALAELAVTLEVTPRVVFGFVGAFALASFIVPGALLEWLNLAHTYYFVTTDSVVIVDGAVFRRARRFAIPRGREWKPVAARAGSIELGEVDYEEVDASGRVLRRDALPLRLRGLGDRAGEVARALDAARA